MTINIISNASQVTGNLATVVKRNGVPGFITNYAPGGLVPFEIVFTNTSPFPLQNVVITDVFPNNYIGNHAYSTSNVTTQTQVGTPIALEFLQNNQWNPITLTTSPNASNASGFRYTMPAGYSLMPGESINIIILGNTLTGAFNDTILNTATATYAPIIPTCKNPNGDVVVVPGENGGFSQSGSATFVTDGNDPKIRIGKLVCEKLCFNVGDEVRFQLHVINLGSAPINGNGLRITDMLPANLTFIGGSEAFYMFPYSTSGAHPSFVDCENDTRYRNFLINNPSVITSQNTHGANSLSWHIAAGQLTINPNPPSFIQPNYTQFSDRIIITFSCRVNNIPIPNNRGFNNNLTTDRNDIVANIHSSAYYNICPKDELTAQKLVSVDGTHFTNQVNAPAGTNVKYQIRLTNSGNMPLHQIRIVDDMPHQGDRFLGSVNGISCSSRNSQFEIGANHTNLLVQGNISFFNQHIPCISALFNYSAINASSNQVTCCGSTRPTTPLQTPTSQGFYIDLGNQILLPGDTFIYEFDGTLPPGLNDGLTSCNSFSFRASRVNSNVVLELGESNTACVTIENPVQSSCQQCESISVLAVHGRLTPQQTRGGVAYQLLQNRLRILAPQTNFNQIRVNVVSYSFESNFDECLICDKNAFNNVGINGDVFQQTSPFVMVDGQPTAPFSNTNHLNLNVGEVNWRSSQTFDFSTPVDLPIQLFLPNFSKIDCCKVKAKVCLRITFLNENCEVCERIVCFDSDVIDEEVSNCECQKSDSFEVSYDKKQKLDPRKFPSKLGCGRDTAMPTGMQVVMTNSNACAGDENCKARYEWQLVETQTQTTISSGNGSAVNFTVPRVGTTYILYIKTFCGNQVCENPCKILIKPIKY